MAARPLTERVQILEEKVDGLQELPARMGAVESQILQLRSEMRDEFSAIHEQLSGHDQRLDETNQTMRVLHEEVLTRIDETNRSMRVLHEETLSRMSLLQEGRQRKKKR